MPLPNYVKFLRGSQTAYNNLSKKDENTLYFIYNTEDESKGSLYLGSRLISSNIGGSGINSMAELTDTLITEAHTGDFLILNSEKKWINVSATTVAETILSAAYENFISDIDEKEFELNAVDKLELKGFSNASKGMVPVKGDINLEWSHMPPDLSSQVGNLENSITLIQQELNQVDAKILNANHLKYKIVQDLSDAINENTVYLHSNESNEEHNSFNEYMLVNGSLEKIGSFSPDLTQYATKVELSTAVGNLNNELDKHVLKTTFQSVVGDLSNLLNYNNLESDASIANHLEDIYERLVWQDISL